MHYQFGDMEGDSLVIAHAESSRQAPQGPEVGILVHAVVLVEGMVESVEGEHAVVVLERDDAVRVHVGDIRSMSTEVAHIVLDTSSKILADMMPLPWSPADEEELSERQGGRSSSAVPVSIVPSSDLGSVNIGPPVASEDSATSIRALVLAEVRNAFGAFSPSLKPGESASEMQTAFSQAPALDRCPEWVTLVIGGARLGCLGRPDFPPL